MSERGKGKVRLACLHCDIEDYDGITPKKLKELQTSGGWTDVDRFQTYRESVTPSPPAESALDWYTHIGVCPDCKDEA